MAEYEQAKFELDALEVTVVAASVDSEEHAQEMAATGLSFPVGYGVSKDDIEKFGGWWSEDRGGFIQPAEFLVGRGGVVLGSMYASGPVGRMRVDEVIRQVTNRERRRREEEEAATH